MKNYSTTEARKHMKEIFNTVSYGGRPVSISRQNGKEKVLVVPYPSEEINANDLWRASVASGAFDDIANDEVHYDTLKLEKL